MTRPEPLSTMRSIDQQLLCEAAAWLVKLTAPSTSAKTRVAFERWCAASAEHQRAWTLAQQLQTRLKNLPPGLQVSEEVRDQLRLEARQSRRQALQVLGLSGLSIGSGVLVARQLPWASWSADLVTGVGELREIQLSDNLKLTLNTDSALDQDQVAHRLILRTGQVLLERTSDVQPPGDAWQIQTALGWVDLVGRRTALHMDGNRLRVSALDGPSRLTRQDSRRVALDIPTGQVAVIDDGAIPRLLPGDLNDELWTRGLLLADSMPLGHFIAQISRYHRGVIRCDEQAAGLSVSGIYPLHDLEPVIAVLRRDRRLRLAEFGRFWIDVRAA